MRRTELPVASGLVNCMAGELLRFGKMEISAWHRTLKKNSVSIVIFGSDENIGEGSHRKAYRQGCVCTGLVEAIGIGRVVNALGQPIDGAGPVDTKRI
ncbi:MAG: hypothetical protein ACLUS5_18265 [Roseburia faecis]